jgi:hypothetical protein
MGVHEGENMERLGIRQKKKFRVLSDDKSLRRRRCSSVKRVEAKVTSLTMDVFTLNINKHLRWNE